MRVLKEKKTHEETAKTVATIGGSEIKLKKI